MIGDKSDAADRPDVYVGRDIAGVYEIASFETYEADDITDEGEFPEFGDFVKAYEVDTNGTAKDEACYLALYVELDRQLDEVLDEEGDRVSIEAVRETRDGGYVMDVERQTLG